jgi:plastocyanin
MHFSTAFLALAPLVAAQYDYPSPGTTTMMTSAVASSTTAASGSVATAGPSDTLVVNVGKNGLTFSPSVVSAQVGAKLEFHFFPKNHSVAQSSFAAPCQPLAGGVFAGFMPVSSTSGGDTTFTVTVNDTKPIWFYCPQALHCEAGMSMVVNEPTDVTKSLAAYQAAAKGVTSSGEQPAVAGGVLGTVSGTSASGTASATGSATGTSTAAATPSTAAAVAGSIVDWSLMGLVAALFMI